MKIDTSSEEANLSNILCYPSHQRSEEQIPSFCEEHISKGARVQKYNQEDEPRNKYQNLPVFTSRIFSKKIKLFTVNIKLIASSFMNILQLQKY